MAQCLLLPGVVMPGPRSAFFLSLLWVLSVGVTGSAAAEEDEGATMTGYTPASQREERDSLLPFRVDVHSALTWEADVGAGLRANISVFDKARLHSANDELAISVGCDVSFITFGGSNRVTSWPTVSVLWSLSVSDRFLLAPELGIVARIERDTWKGIYPNIGFGGRYYLWRSVAITARLGWPMAISLGACF